MTSRSSGRREVTGAEPGLSVRLRLPGGGPELDRSPLLVLLHGVGSNEDDLFGLEPALDPRLILASLRAPVVLAPGQYAWFHVQLDPVAPLIEAGEAEFSRRALAQSIRQLAAAHSADPQRVYLLGFSQGAIMALALALTEPVLLAGVVAVAGRTLPELFAEGTPLSGKLAPADEVRGLPILVIHGTQDAVLPIHFGRDTRKRLGASGVNLEYHELPMGHSITSQALEIIVNWFSQRLGEPGSGRSRERRPAGE